MVFAAVYLTSVVNCELDVRDESFVKSNDRRGLFMIDSTLSNQPFAIIPQGSVDLHASFNSFGISARSPIATAVLIV